MERRKVHIHFLSFAEQYLKELAPPEQATVVGDVEGIRSGNFAIVHTKQLRGPIRELIVGHHRFTYFQLRDILYFVRGFRKKSSKTPLSEIEYAMKIYKIMKNQI